MALTLTDRGVAQTAQGGAITMSVASASLSPNAGDLIVIPVSAQCKQDAIPTTDLTFVITDTIGDSGGNITSWSHLDSGGNAMVCTRGAVGTGVYMEKVELWWRVLGNGPGAAKLITVTGSSASGAQLTSTDGWVWANFLEISGQAATNPIETSTGSTSRQTAGPTTYACALGTAPSASSMLISILQDDRNATGSTIPTGFTNLTETLPGSGFAGYHDCYRNDGASTQTSTWTALDALASYLGSALAIKAAAGSFIAKPPVVVRQAVARASVR